MTIRLIRGSRLFLDTDKGQAYDSGWFSVQTK
jgi:hypothetical protein